MRRTWEIVHDADDDDGTPTMWNLEANHPEYGKYIWISLIHTGEYVVEVETYDFITLVTCKTLTSAKRWVSTHLK